MTSSVQLLFALRVALKRANTGWPDATQGEDAITCSLAGVDLSVWNDAYIAKLIIAGGVTTTVDFQNFTTLVFEAGKSFSKMLALVVQVALSNPANTDAHLKVKPGAVNPLQWFFTSTTQGITLEAGDTHAHIPSALYSGFTVDGTHKTLDFTNTGADSLVATIIALGKN